VKGEREEMSDRTHRNAVREESKNDSVTKASPPMRITGRIRRGLWLLVHRPMVFVDRVSTHVGWFIWLLCRRPMRKRITGVMFEFDFALSRYIKSMYFGWYESDIVEILKRVLKQGDVFIDVGANIGYLSAIGAGLVGKTGQVHSFEPAPPYFHRLEKFAQMNPRYRIRVNQCALGDEERAARLFLSNKNIGVNWVALDNNPEATVDIVVRRLDEYISEHIIQRIALIKIDVEGFEFHVLKGLTKYLENVDVRPVIVCEIFPSNHSQDELTQLLEFTRRYGYRTYDPLNLEREIDIMNGWNGANVVFRS